MFEITLFSLQGGTIQASTKYNCSSKKWQTIVSIKETDINILVQSSFMPNDEAESIHCKSIYLDKCHIVIRVLTFTGTNCAEL
jgi:hypothetical protein